MSHAARLSRRTLLGGLLTVAGCAALPGTALPGTVLADPGAPAAPGAGPEDGMPLPDGRRLGGVRYLSRAGWGADEALRFAPDGREKLAPDYQRVQAFTCHHTDTPNEDRDPAATVRSVYRQHAVDRNLGDIGYHLLIDGGGVVYEGRWSGTGPAPVFGPGGGPARSSSGAHTEGHNSGNVGIALIGTFESAQPTPAARDALVRVLSALASVVGIAPAGDVDYVNPVTGERRRMPAISGHRDWIPTGCPGSAFHGSLPALRGDVAGTKV